MSRTFRRTDAKAQHHIADWVLTDIIYPDGWPSVWGYRRVKIDAHSKLGKKLISEYHREGYRFMGPPPSWYCNIFQRCVRQEGRRQLHKYMEYPENVNTNSGYSVLLCGNHKHCAMWSWW